MRWRFVYLIMMAVVVCGACNGHEGLKAEAAADVEQAAPSVVAVAEPSSTTTSPSVTGTRPPSSSTTDTAARSFSTTTTTVSGKALWPLGYQRPAPPNGWTTMTVSGLWRLERVGDDDRTLVVRVATSGCLKFDHMTVDR